MTKFYLESFTVKWKSLKKTAAYTQLREVLKERNEEKTVEKAQEEEESVIEALRRQHLEQELDKKQRTFDKELAKTRPVLNERASVNRIENKGAKLATKLTPVFESVISFQMGLSFIQKMISQDLGAEGASLDYAKMTEYAKRCCSVPLLLLICEHFGIDERFTNTIVDLTLERYWGPKPKPKALPQESGSALQTALLQKLSQVLDHLPSPDNKPFGPMLNKKNKERNDEG